MQNTVGFALVDTMKHYKWKTLGMMYDNDQCSAIILPSILEALGKNADDINVSVVINLLNATDSIEDHLEELRVKARSNQLILAFQLSSVILRSYNFSVLPP